MGGAEGAEVVQVLLRRGDAGRHVLAVLDVFQAGAVLVAPVAQGLLVGEAELQGERLLGDLFGDPHGGEHRFGGAGVGAHQAAGAQFDAAEVAADHHHDVPHPFVLNHVEDRLAGGAGGFAVVVHGALAGLRVADQPGVAVVAGVRVAGAGLLEHGLGLVAVLDRAQPGDEAAFVDDQFAVDGAGGGWVSH